MNRILERIQYIAESENISLTALEAKIGASKGVLSRALKNNTDIQSKWITALVENYPLYNISWLITGQGVPIVKGNNTTNQKFDSFGSYKDQDGVTRSEFLLRTDKVMQHNQIIPLYDIHATAGLVTLFKNDKQTPIDYYSIPNLPKVDGAVQITGDSMYPILKSGDIVFYREINNILENIYYGEMYLLDIQNDDDEYTTVKYIQTSEKGPEWIKIVSYNSHHSPKDIHLSSVKAAAFIKGSLRLNSMR